MVVPEVQLKKVLDGVIMAINLDMEANVADEPKSWLYRMFNGNVSQNWDYFTEAKAIFTRAVDHPRKLETRLFFDRSRASIPTVHLTMPSLQVGNDGIGMDEGYVEPLTDIATDESATAVYTRAFNTVYHLIITSDNAFEVLTIYHAVKAALMVNIESLEYYGLKNVKFSGQDLQLNDAIAPGVYSRGIGIDCMYEASVPTFRTTQMATDVTPIDGTPIN